MRLLSLIFIPLGLLIELLAVWVFIAGWHGPVGLTTILFVHLIGCAVLIVGVYLALPPNYKRPVGGGFAFLATAAVLAPPLGALGLVMGMLPGRLSLAARRSSRVSGLRSNGCLELRSS